MKKANSLTSSAAVLGLTLAIGWGSAAVAQQQFDEETLSSFAVAAVQIQQIGEAAQQQLQAAEAPDQEQQVQMQAQQQMLQAVEAEGLTVEQYNEIATAAQADPELAQQIEQHFAEAAQQQ